jgi:hypothetical protein
MATGEGLHAGLARYREIQAANKAAVEEQQEYLLCQRLAILDQTNSILEQWQTFLGEAEKRRQLLRDTEQELFRAQADLEDELRQGKVYYRDSPPFRILYDPKPEEYADYERGRVSERFQIASEPTNLKILKVRLDNLAKLNKSFTAVNKAFEDVNTAIAARFAQVEAAMNTANDALDKVKDAMTNVNALGQGLGQGFKVAPKSIAAIAWTIPPGTTEYGSALKTSWNVDYPRTFKLTVCLLDVRGNDDVEIIQRQSLTLTNDISWNGLLKPEPVSEWVSFNNVKIEDISAEGYLMVWIESVNGISVEDAALNGYIEVIPDRARIAAIGMQTAARESWRKYWSDTRRFNSLGVAAGTAFATPAFLASARLTYSPFPYFFFEAGSDFGLAHGMPDVQDVGYLSIAPYLHLNGFITNHKISGADQRFGGYIGVGGGASFSQYTYPPESHVDPVKVNTGVFDANAGVLWMFSHSVIDLRYTLKTNFKGIDNRVTLGYIYRFGYFAWRYGGTPLSLINRR